MLENTKLEILNNNTTKITKIKFTDFDQIFDRIKHYGHYQFFMLVVIQYIMLNSAGNYIFISFATLRPICQFNPIIISNDVCYEIAKCPPNSSTSVFRSLYEENQFVCPDSHLPHHLQTLQAIGSGVGAIVGGHFADIFGRKWVTYLGAFHMCAFGILGAFSWNWWFLAISMLGMGLSYGVLIDASMTLASETVGPRYRIVQTLAFQWSLALQIASLLAYLTSDWRRYLLSINCLCLPVLILMLFWRESPRWLIQKRRPIEACKELNAISSFNGCSARFVEDDLNKIELSYLETKNCKVYSFFDLFATKDLALYSIVMFFSALTVETSVAVIIFDVQILAGNPFLNVALYGILRIWVPFFIVLMEAKSRWFGRRFLFISAQSTTVICYGLIVLLLIFDLKGQSIDVARTVLSLIGGVINSGIFFTIYKQYTIELYPTLMRGMAVGAFGVIERVGGGLAPQLINLNAVLWPFFAIAVTTILALISLILGYFILPETRNMSMPDVINDSDETIAYKKSQVS